LVLFQNDEHSHARFDVHADLTIHGLDSF
jgi:hypothetical protein